LVLNIKTKQKNTKQVILKRKKTTFYKSKGQNENPVTKKSSHEGAEEKPSTKIKIIII